MFAKVLYMKDQPNWTKLERRVQSRRVYDEANERSLEKDGKVEHLIAEGCRRDAFVSKT